MPTPRYAIYYSPEPGSPLDAFANAWLGSNEKGSGTGPSADFPVNLSRAQIDSITAGTRRYGFHGTLKPPFELHAMATVEGLLKAARVFAHSLGTVELPPLDIAIIGKFIALTPSYESAALEKLAAACVRAFEGYRKPMSAEQIAQYKQNKLTVHQEQMLEHWGYPYVMEEFRFHMSLTDRIETDSERDAALAALAVMAKPILNKPLAVRALTVFHQPDVNAPMIPIERIPFSRG